MIEHHIALILSEEIDARLLREWFSAVRDNAPTGTVIAIPVDGKPVQIIKRKEGNVRYMVPLSRDLTDVEIKAVIDAFAHATDRDFEITATASPLDISVSPEVTIDHDPMMALCTKWAKKKHDDWCSAKTDSGWRYGPSVSQTNKTHPLLRSWSEIPAEYRKVDTTPAQELLDLLRDSGYVIVQRDDIERLLGDGR